jgi:hypothetical protein
MVTNPKLGPPCQLCDLTILFHDIDHFWRAGSWSVHVATCLGGGAQAIDCHTTSVALIADQQFRRDYCGIYLTVSGSLRDRPIKVR